ncbi:MAG TPA: hypothetical protein VMU40_15965 [Steroidobacteraceae bacterium]|nr:hypothetical protein [Steroidobacteraceae bacterium]
MSFREKSIALQMLAIVLVYGLYGAHFYQAHLWRAPLSPVPAVATLIGIAILMIIIAIVGHIAIAMRTRPEAPDERDWAVELRGARNAYRALGAGMWCILLLSLLRASYGIVFYAILAAFALGELVRLGSQLIYYRSGT